MSKKRRGRMKGVRKSQLRHYSANTIPVGRNPNPLILREHVQRLDSYRRSLLDPAYEKEPERKQIQVDYSPNPTPLETEPFAKVQNKRELLRITPDFYDGLDTYHRVNIVDTDTLKIFLFFHANHFFFVMNDLIKKEKYISHDFNNRDRALLCYRLGNLRWKPEDSIE